MTHSVAPSGRTPAVRSRAAVRLVVATTLCLLAAGLVWGLGSALAVEPSVSPGANTVTLHVGWTNDPDNLNPFIGAETSSYEIWMLNYDFLTGYTLDLQPKPDLATSWEHSADDLVWTFHLRNGVKWQDGVAFTAKDVAFTYNYIIKNQMGAFSSLTTHITKVVAINDTTVEFRCDFGRPNLPRSSSAITSKSSGLSEKKRTSCSRPLLPITTFTGDRIPAIVVHPLHTVAP